MTIFTRLFGKRAKTNFATTMERQRLSNTMPGQTAAVAANRLGVLLY